MSKSDNPTNPTRNEEKVAEWKARFLTRLAATGSVLKSCRAIRKDRSWVYDCRNNDPDFDRAWKLALEEWGDISEDELHRRAIKGVLKPIYQNGKRVGHVREYSDSLLLAAVKAAKPEKYRERIDNRHAGGDGGAIRHHLSGSVDLKLLTDDELRTLDELYDRAHARAGQNGAGKT